MLKKRMYPLLAASILLLALTGCGAAKSENITAGMEAIKSLDYDTALTCFEAAKERMNGFCIGVWELPI